MSSPRILLHGSGAIGTIYVYLLLKAGYDVTAVCRSNYEAAKANGFLIDSDRYGKGIRIHPKVVCSPGEAAEAGQLDFLIVTTKALPDAETSKVIAPAVTEGKTTIVLIQNGVGIEDEYARMFPQNPILSCVVYLPTTQIRPGVIQMGTFESLELGTFPASAYSKSTEVREAADMFMDIMQKSGSQVKWYDDIQEKRWNKLLLNAPWNPICALTLSRDAAFLASDSSANKVIEDVMLEVVAVAQKLGYGKISPAAAGEQLKRAEGRVGTKGIEPSMLVDVLNGRRMEVDAILGSPVRVAKSVGIDVPRLELLYGLMKALDESMAYKQAGQSLGGDETRLERSKRGESVL
ncbi:uncharacterized protein LTR77_004133 [Saxophila tyrrhenica]|uniref:2-dehydropantoate 2-reductase n=1 Tax=Saxophila tyrrhenica TaxID=1690608 RepID=A0AAV9PBS3_9PEZI|nr:hypothetical protein LTR77_004133 [Saxophila tyrrhenica]